MQYTYTAIAVDVIFPRVIARCLVISLFSRDGWCINICNILFRSSAAGEVIAERRANTHIEGAYSAENRTEWIYNDRKSRVLCSSSEKKTAAQENKREE